MKLRNRIAGVCALCGVAVSATAETVEYWDPVGKVTRSVEATVVTTDTATLAGGWYVVRGEVSRAQIEVTGTDASPANLILADGAVLTVTESGEDNPGIKVASGAALNIYGGKVTRRLSPTRRRPSCEAGASGVTRRARLLPFRFF